MKKILIGVCLLVVGVAGWWFLSNPQKASEIEPNFSPAAADTFSKKLEVIAASEESHRPTRVDFTEAEIDSYLHYRVAPFYPEGLEQVRIKLLENEFVANALVDFDRLQAGGNSKNPLLEAILNGQHELEVTGKLRAEKGVGNYEVHRVRLDQKEIPKPLVDFLINKYVVPKYPAAKPGVPFSLPFDIEAVHLSAGRLAIQRGA